MVIAKKPNSNTLIGAIPNPEKAAEAFISGAGKTQNGDFKKKKNKRPFMMRLEDEMFDKIDNAVSKSGNSRAAWIRNAIIKALEE